MKKIISFFMTLAIIAITLAAVTSCGTAKVAPGETVVKVYCSGPEYLTDATAFRYSAIGISMDQMASKDKAMSNAKAGLTAQIKTTLDRTITNYLKSSTHNNKEDLINRYEGEIKEVIKQTLEGTRTVCEQMTKTKDGNYKTYICVELAGPEVLALINNRLSKDELLKIEYDYEKFKKNLKEEMNKHGK